MLIYTLTLATCENTLLKRFAETQEFLQGFMFYPVRIKKAKIFFPFLYQDPDVWRKPEPVDHDDGHLNLLGLLHDAPLDLHPRKRHLRCKLDHFINRKLFMIVIKRPIFLV